MFPAAPNPPTEVYDPSDDEIVLAELAYSPMFRRFIDLVIKPRIVEIREKLLRNMELSERERLGYVIYLAETEKMFESVYSKTEAGTTPENIRALFR